MRMSSPRCFRVNPADNVATLLDDADNGPVVLLGDVEQTLVLREPVKLGHKIALSEIAQGAAVIKFGVPIGQATRPIAAGEWVHLHNCASNFDQRSQTLDVHTGAVTDTRYE